MRRGAMLVSLTVVLVLVVLGAGLVAFAYSGAANVAASEDYLPGVRWFLDTTSTHSVRAHAREAVERGEVTAPAEVTDTMLATGAVEYREMCMACHGTPGGPRGELGRGMKPEPPDLGQVAREMPLPEVFWVVRHGIRHTGMPAFGEMHDEQELWSVAAFVNSFDEMTAADFERWMQRSGGERDAH